MEDATFEYIKTPGFPTLKLARSAAPSKSPYLISINSLYDIALIVDNNGRIIIANDKANRRLSSTTGKLIGSHIKDVIKNADDDLFKRIMANVAERQYTIMEAVCIGSNGKNFIAEIAISPERIEPSKGICFQIRDITARAQAEEKLKTVSQALYNANYGVAIFNEQLQVEFINPALLNIIQLIKGNSISKPYEPDVFKELKLSESFLQSAYTEGATTEIEFKTVSSEEPIKVRLSCVPNKDKNEKLLGVILFCENISMEAKLEQEKRKAEEQRLLAEHWKERLQKLSDLTYAINNPLQALLGKAELENRQEEKSLILQVVGILKEYIKSESAPVEDMKSSFSPHINTLSALMPAEQNTLLLVEDDKNVSEIFLRIIGKTYPHLKIYSAFTGREGLEKFSLHHPAMMVLDINIPEMDGVELYKAIKNLCEKHLWEEPYIIFCTGFSSPPELTELISNDAKHILLTKPITGAVLIKAIEKFAVIKQEE